MSARRAGGGKTHRALGFASTRVCVLPLIIVCSAVAGCGGSGGSAGGSTSTGSGNGGVATVASLYVNPTTLTVSASTADSAPTATIYTAINFPAGTLAGSAYYIGATATDSGIASVTTSQSPSSYNFVLQFKSPLSIGVGTYHDTVIVSGCPDTQCTRQVSGSPVTIPVTYTVTQGQIQVSSLSPSTTVADSPGFTMQVAGSYFTQQMIVEWNGTPLPTTYVSSSSLSATVATANLTAPGSIPVTVAVTGGATSSAALSFVVQPLAVLSLGSVSPATVYSGGPGFDLTVLGQGFTASSEVQWNGSAKTTRYVSTNELLAQISASDIAAAGTAAVTVQNPSNLGGASGTLSVTVAPPLKDAVAFQITPEHSGAVSFNSVTLPSTSTWSVDVGGSPSYALIADGEVIVAVNDPEQACLDPTTCGSELIALDQSTGAAAWGPVAVPGIAPGAAYDDGTVFVSSDTNGWSTTQIQAYDASTGTLEWSTPYADAVAAPTATDGYVFFTNAAGSLDAVSEAEGETAWTAPLSGLGTNSIPAVTADGVYAAPGGWTYDFRPATGESIWSSNSYNNGFGYVPVAANGVLYAPTGPSADSGLQFNAETGAGLGSYTADNPPAIGAQTGYFLQSGTLQAIDLSSNAVIWTFTGDGGLTTSPIIVNNYVFIGSSTGNLYSLDAATGAVVWQQNVGAAIPATGVPDGLNPVTGLSAGDGLLVVPAGTKVVAYTLSSSP